MAWLKVKFDGQKGAQEVWAEVDEAGRFVERSGRVPIRYKGAEGEKIYSGGRNRIYPVEGAAPEDLPAGVPADASVAGRPARGSGFGSAGSRTEAQAALAKAHFDSVLSEISPEAAVCFTDGACQGNPGPCGAGVVVKLPDGRRLEAYKALGMGTNNVGELTAVELALDLLDKAGHPREAPTWIFTDSQYALGVLAKGWKAQANVPLINRVRPRLSHRKAQLTWLAGHVGIVENERADELANQGVTESKR